MRETSKNVTRVQLAVPADILPEMQLVLRNQHSLEVIKPGITGGEGLLETVLGNQPDIVLLDMTLPNLDASLVLTALSSKKLPPYLVATAPQYRPYLLDLRKYPAVRGVLPRVLALSVLLRRVMAAVAKGGTYFFSSPPADHPELDLTSNDMELLALISAGLKPYEVAQELEYPLHKVYTRESHLRKKLGVDINPEAMNMGIGTGLVGVLVEPGRSTKRSA
jgi:DNA-binding NarL/FixJ family response regulator